MAKNDIERLFRSNYVAMYTLACRLVHDEEVARDIVHDVFATLLAADLLSVTSAYLLRSVRNGCLNHIRNHSTRQRINSLYSMELEELDDESWPDENVVERIHNIVDQRLSEQCRKVVSMRFGQDMSYKDISYTLGISEVAVYKHLRHALVVIRQNLKDNE